MSLRSSRKQEVNISSKCCESELIARIDNILRAKEMVCLRLSYQGLNVRPFSKCACEKFMMK